VSRVDRARRCLAQLEDALARPPDQLGEEVDQVERELATLRDELIADLRANGRRAGLDQVNAVLSLVVGLEYPATGIQRTLIEQARDALRALLDSGEFNQAGLDATPASA
jgi:hypothetical protein